MQNEKALFHGDYKYHEMQSSTISVDQKDRSSDWFEVTHFVSLEQNSRSYQFEKKLSRKKIRILLSLLSTNPITGEHFVSVLYLFGQFQR